MKRDRIAAGAGLGFGALLAVPAAAQAEDIKVTNLNDDGAGSLRAAVERANSDEDADRILFRSKLSGRIELDSTLVILRDLSILGPGARQLTLDGGGDENVFALIASGVPTLDATISRLRLTRGYTAFYGGAINAYEGVDLTVSRTTITGSVAGDSGGGIYSNAFDGDGRLVVEDSTIAGNSTSGGGGAIFARNFDLTIVNSTISGNSGTVGGGVYLQAIGADPSFELRNSTVTRNTADGVGGLAENGVQDVSIRGSIVAGNTDDNNVSPDLDEGPWDTAFSLIGNSGVATIIDAGGTLLDVDPKLKPLKNNGGPTNTHAFKKSPAKNKGPSDAPNSDQRGAPRKGNPDIGAYELTKCKGVIVNRVGTAGKDKLKGTRRKDGILGLGGNDTLSGKKGKDGLCGGQGKDKLKGGPGKDKLNGGPGKDKEVQ
jgi:hemolysin type calcium-binding protein